MALNIKNPRVDRLARRAAELRDSTVTEAVEAALERDVIELEKAREAQVKRRLALTRTIQAEIAALPILDARSAKEITDDLWDDVLDRH